MKYTKLTKEEFDTCIKDNAFKNIYNKIEKLKRILEKRKGVILNEKTPS